MKLKQRTISTSEFGRVVEVYFVSDEKGLICEKCGVPMEFLNETEFEMLVRLFECPDCGHQDSIMEPVQDESTPLK